MQTNEKTDRHNEESSRFFKFFESTSKTFYVPLDSLFARTFPSTVVAGLTQSVPFIASPSRAALKNKNLYLPGHAMTSVVLWVTTKEAHSISNIYILEG